MMNVEPRPPEICKHCKKAIPGCDCCCFWAKCSHSDLLDPCEGAIEAVDEGYDPSGDTFWIHRCAKHAEAYWS